MFPIIISQIQSTEDRLFFEKLYREKHHSILNKLESQIFNASDVQDLEQDVWKKLIENTDTLRKLDEFQLNQYILKTIHSIRVDYIRKNSKTETLELNGDNAGSLDELKIQDIARTVEEAMACEQLMEDFPKLLQKLSPVEQQMFHYKFVMREGNEEIAGHTGLTQASVNRNVRRTKQKLLKLIREWAG